MKLSINCTNNVWTGVIEGRLDTANAILFEKEMQPLLAHAHEEIVLE